jgi:hypothetical protein
LNYYINGKKIPGIHASLWGDVSGLWGDVDDCELSADERRAGVDVGMLVSPPA